MTRDDTIRMAREAQMPYYYRTGQVTNIEQLERFAELVAAAEREACALLCENMTLEWADQPSIAQAELATLMDCALAIRNRGQE